MSAKRSRRPLEAAPALFKRSDRWAKLEGISWAEFARRALQQRGTSIEDLVSVATDSELGAEAVALRLPGLSEKPGPKNEAARPQKRAASSGRRKG